MRMLHCPADLATSSSKTIKYKSSKIQLIHSNSLLDKYEVM